MRLLDRQRIQTMIRLLELGERPPVPRPPLASCDPIWVAEQANLPAETIALIARNELGLAEPEALAG